MNTTQAGANAISEGEFRTMPEDDQDEYLATIDDDDDVQFTDDVTPDMLTAETIEEMRGWLADLTLPDGVEVTRLDACEIISMVTTGYDGGIAQFLADGN